MTHLHECCEEASVAHQVDLSIAHGSPTPTYPGVNTSLLNNPSLPAHETLLPPDSPLPLLTLFLALVTP